MDYFKGEKYIFFEVVVKVCYVMVQDLCKRNFDFIYDVMYCIISYGEIIKYFCIIVEFFIGKCLVDWIKIFFGKLLFVSFYVCFLV